MNYPDNVTGDEFELAGPDWSGSLEIECGVMTELTVMNPAISAALYVAKNTRNTADLRDVLNQFIDFSDVYQVQTVCPFDGEVDAWSFEGLMHWQCPLCDWEHTWDWGVDCP